MIKGSNKLAEYHYAIRDIVAAAERLELDGQSVIHLNIGDPQAFGFRPPEEVVEAVERAVRNNFTGYAHSAGLFQARIAVADYASQLGSPTIPDDVILTGGSSEAADLVLTGLLNPGDEVLLPSPGYPLYPAILQKLGAIPRFYHLDDRNDWQPDVEEITLLVEPRVKAIILINPNNPTGAITANETTREILELAAALNILVISDEVYRELCFSPRPVPASDFARETGGPLITLESLSKTHMLSGWRVGWMRFTNVERMTDLKAAIGKLASGRLCSPTPAQYAINPALEDCAAFQHEFCDEIKRRRDFAVEKINAIRGLTCLPPAAAFYLMVKVDEPVYRGDEKFVLDMLQGSGVLVVPGSGFGCDERAGYFRMVYLADRPILTQAFDRISKFLGGGVNENAATSLEKSVGRSNRLNGADLAEQDFNNVTQ